MRGVVLDNNGNELSGVLVEVFDHPEGLLLPYPQNQEAQLKQRRIAASKTGKSGRFCFPGLPNGKYELRCSFQIGVDVTHVYVRIGGSHGKAAKKELKVQMYLGD
jgi:protocatechuate 3,4-dioxygenase beta subunit